METSQDKYSLTSLRGAILAVLLAAAFTCGVVTAASGSLFLAAIIFAAAAACQIYIDTYAESISAYLIPLPAVFLPCFFGVEVYCSAVIVGTVLIASIVCGYAYSRHADAFRTTALTAAILSVGIGMLFAVIMHERYGSVGGGISTLIETYKENVMELSDILNAEYGIDTGISADMLILFGEMMFMLVPTVSFILGLIGAWITKGFLAILSRISGKYRDLFSVPSKIPAPLGVVFILILFAELFGASDGGALYYIMLNIRYILMFLLAGEGIKAYILSLSLAHTDNMLRVMVKVLAGVAAVLFFPAFVPVIAAYYAAYLSVFGKFRKNAQQN